MSKLPTAAAVRELAEELRLSREHFVALEYYDDAQDMLAAIELLLQFAELLETEGSQAQKISFLISVVKSGEQITETEEEMLRNPAARLLPQPPEAE